jgi:hypothetical protein
MRKQHSNHNVRKAYEIYFNKKGGDVTERTKAGTNSNDPLDLKCIDY